MAQNQPAITDMHVFPLQRQGDRLTLLRNDQHLLRRFGQLELIDVAASELSAYTVRAEADRFVFTLSGRVTATLVDLREHSPSRGQRVELTLDAAEPQGVLVPFGVALALHAQGGARVLMLSTHSEPHAQDRQAGADEVTELIRVQ